MITKEDYDLSDNADLLGVNIFSPINNPDLLICYCESLNHLGSQINQLKKNLTNTEPIVQHLSQQQESLRKDFSLYFEG